MSANMSERDELARIIESVDSAAGWDVSPDSYAMYADAILAAGYRKPRAITTAEELDALGFQSVVIDAYGTPYVCERHWTDGTRNEWQPAGMSHLDDSGTILYHGPATVLYEPTA